MKTKQPKRGRVRARIPLPKHPPMRVPNKKKDTQPPTEEIIYGELEPWTFSGPGVFMQGFRVVKEALKRGRER